MQSLILITLKKWHVKKEEEKKVTTKKKTRKQEKKKKKKPFPPQPPHTPIRHLTYLLASLYDPECLK